MIQFFNVIPKIWCLRRPSYLTCSYVIEVGDGLVFVDASMDSEGADVKHALEKLGRGGESVKAVLLTHWHNDHSSGAFYLNREFGTEIFAHSLEADKLTSAPSRSLGPVLSRWIPESGPLVLLKGLLNDGPSIRLEKVTRVADGQVILGRFEVVLTAGHTAGHLSFFDRETKTLFAGDALAVIDDEIRRMARPVTEDLPSALASMKRLCEFDAAVLCPGHRLPMTNVNSKLKLFADRLNFEKSWPLFG